jgi:DNA-binding beta-propeller fold protein YncE
MKLIPLAVLLLALVPGTPASAQPFYRLESVVPIRTAAPDWDYLSVDAERGRLFIAARPDGLLVFDTRTASVTGSLEDTKGANASLPVPEFDRLYSVNQDGTLTVFQLSTLKKVDKVRLGDDADAAFYDSATRQIAVMRGDAAEITYIDAASGKIVARLKMPTKKLEGSAADGQGFMFTASRDRNSVFRIDMRTHTIAAEYPAGCEEANGMAIDRARGRLFVGCRGKSPVLSVMDAQSGRVIATLEIGRGNDGVIYDPETRKVYASNGVDANLVVYEQLDADTYRLAEATTTRPYARTMALDSKTKKLYLVTAEGTADPGKKINRAVAAFYPNRYFPDTFAVLIYSLR